MWLKLPLIWEGGRDLLPDSLHRDHCILPPLPIYCGVFWYRLYGQMFPENYCIYLNKLQYIYFKKSVKASDDEKKPQVFLHLFLLYMVTREMKIYSVLGSLFITKCFCFMHWMVSFDFFKILKINTISMYSFLCFQELWPLTLVNLFKPNV